MATALSAPLPRPHASRLTGFAGRALLRGMVTGYLSVLVLLPLAAIVWRSTGLGPHAFWQQITMPDAVASVRLTVAAAILVALINGVMGTIIAWVLVRDTVPGRALVDTIIDLPFALPTIVAGLTLVSLYGPRSPLHINAAYTRAGVILALLFVTLPFVVRSVQPILLELDRDMEEAAASLGAGPYTIFRRIVLPNILPAVLAGVSLGFARAMGEFGSVVLISGNLPFQTEVASVHIYAQIESNNLPGAAALSVELLVITLAVLIALNTLSAWRARHVR